MYGPTVKIFVGPERKDFIVFKEVLCTESTYFNFIFNNRSAEAETNTARLPDEDPNFFVLFLTWLYAEELFPTVKKHRGDYKLTPYHLVRLYTFGHRYGIRRFKNDCADALLHHNTRLSWITEVLEEAEYIYENTAAGSPLQRMLIDTVQHIHRLVLQNGREWLLQLPKPLFVDFLVVRGVEFADMRVNRNPCLYHEHQVGDPPCREKVARATPPKVRFASPSPSPIETETEEVEEVEKVQRDTTMEDARGDTTEEEEGD